MNYQHKVLASGNIGKLTVLEQMANIGSEVERAINWRVKNRQYSNNALIRALELLDLSIMDKKNLTKLKELVRLREVLADYFRGDNIYASTDVLWRKYFYPFYFAARKNT